MKKNCASSWLFTLQKIQKCPLKTNNSAQSFPTGIIIGQIKKQTRLTHYHNTFSSSPGQCENILSDIFVVFLHSSSGLLQITFKQGATVLPPKCRTELRATTHLVIHMSLHDKLGINSLSSALVSHQTIIPTSESF